MAFRIGPAPVPPPKAKRPPANKLAPEPTLFEQLLPCSWRGIQFPVATVTMSLSQELVQHKYFGVDAASVEATGRQPLEIQATIPFYNGIVPGKNEKWGVLYPTVFRDFKEAFEDRTTGIFVHPEFGELVCKPVSMEFAIDAQRRDGVEVTAKWVETLSDDLKTFQVDSPVTVADLAAIDLDASKTDLLALVPDAAFPEETFASMMNKLTAFFDQITVTANLLSNKPNQILFRLQQLQDSAVRARSSLTWPVIDTIERAKAAYHQMGKTLTNPTKSLRKIQRYTTPARMSLSQINLALPTNTMDELIQLNPQLIAHPDVEAGVVIRYYE